MIILYVYVTMCMIQPPDKRAGAYDQEVSANQYPNFTACANAAAKKIKGIETCAATCLLVEKPTSPPK